MANLPSEHFRTALVVSLAVHFLLLAATWPASRGDGGVRAPILATLRVPTLQSRPPTMPRRGAPRLSPSPPAGGVPSSAQAAARTDDSTAELDRRSAAVGGAALGIAATPAGDGLDAEGLRSYRIALATRFRKFYPQSAIEAGWVGTTEVLVTLAADGIAPQVKVLRSSGHGALDDAAVDMLRRAVPLTPLPDALRGRSFAVNLPVKFELLD